MSTILAIGTADGIRRCDARCHDATKLTCDCICGGRYHGRGLDNAGTQLVDDLLEGRLGPELADAARSFLGTGTQEALF